MITQLQSTSEQIIYPESDGQPMATILSNFAGL